MGMSTPTKRWTAREVRALIDESRPSPRYELVDGELLVTPSPQPLHQRAVTLLWQALRAYVESWGIGEVFVSPADLELEPGTIVQPDVFVVPAGGDALTKSWGVVRALLLAVEVLSPMSGRQDRVTKRRFYARVGVAEYWVVDVETRIVERWRGPDERPELLDERLVWSPEGAEEPFDLDLVTFFAKVQREASG